MSLIDWKAEYAKLEKKYKAMMAQRVDYSKAFEKFWAACPWKVGKKATWALWQKLKLTRELFTDIMTGLKNYKASHLWLKDNGKWICKPEKFIKNEMWNDEIVPRYPASGPQKPAVRKCNKCGTMGDKDNPVRDVKDVYWCWVCFQEEP